MDGGADTPTGGIFGDVITYNGDTVIKSNAKNKIFFTLYLYGPKLKYLLLFSSVSISSIVKN